MKLRNVAVTAAQAAVITGGAFTVGFVFGATLVPRAVVFVANGAIRLTTVGSAKALVYLETLKVEEETLNAQPA